jgi:hypothetical protein
MILGVRSPASRTFQLWNTPQPPVIGPLLTRLTAATRLTRDGRPSGEHASLRATNREERCPILPCSVDKPNFR